MIITSSALILFILSASIYFGAPNGEFSRIPCNGERWPSFGSRTVLNDSEPFGNASFFQRNASVQFAFSARQEPHSAIDNVDPEAHDLRNRFITQFIPCKNVSLFALSVIKISFDGLLSLMEADEILSAQRSEAKTVSSSLAVHSSRSGAHGRTHNRVDTESIRNSDSSRPNCIRLSVSRAN